MFVRTLRRPRWAMPIVTSSMPESAAWLRISSSRTIVDSPPSSEKRFWPMYFVCRKVSKASAAFRRPRM